MVVGLIAALTLAVASLWANPLQQAPVTHRADAPGEAPPISKPLTAGVCPGEGNCFEANGTPGCDDTLCCEAVCAVDPSCCEVEWDGQCAAEAAEICGNCGDPAAGSCFEPNGTLGCRNFDCCAAVCAVDTFCCDTQWDQQCANEAAEICATCGGAGAGSCFEPNGTPACDDLECCDAVCAVDPYCCDVEWDVICADEAAEICKAPPPCPSDLDGDGNVGASDLLTLLFNWGPCP